MNNAPFQIQPQFIEKFLYTTIPVKIKNGEIINVRIGGKFDRVDKINIEDKSILRVVDYKTSRWKKQLETKDVESIFGQPKKDKHYDYIFQTKTILRIKPMLMKQSHLPYFLLPLVLKKTLNHISITGIKANYSTFQRLKTNSKIG